MLTCRCLVRAGSVVRLTDIYVQANRVNYFQGHCSFYSLSRRTEHRQTAIVGNTKPKIKNPVWRPVCTQANSMEGLLPSYQSKVNFYTRGSVKNAVVETKAQCSVSANVCGAQDASEVSEAVQKHSLSLEVGASLIRFIRGKEGSTQKKIQEETEVKIIFPSSKKEDCLIIEGISLDNVTRASEKIQTVIDEVVKSPSLDYSHFVSLPLAIHPELVDKLFKFQNSVLGNHGASPYENCASNEETSEMEDKDHQLKSGPDLTVDLKVADESSHVKVDIESIPLVSYLPKASKSSPLSEGIERSIFIKPKTFHLTVLMLKLWNKDRVNAAKEVLKGISSEVIDALDNRPVSVRLKGLECMRGSLAKARVLYAPVEEIGNEDRLLRACQVIIDAFVNAGLVFEKDAKQQLKLHATVMNARHMKRKSGMRKFESFDARGIFKQFGSEEWGEYLLREAHLSQRFAFDESGYYNCCASIPFPESDNVAS